MNCINRRVRKHRVTSSAVMFYDWCDKRNRKSKVNTSISEYVSDQIKTIDKGKVNALAKAGWSEKDIALEMKVSQVVIKRMLKNTRF